MLYNISEWCYYLIAGHGLRLKPGFMNFVRNRIAEMLQNLSGVKDLSKGIQMKPSEKNTMEDLINESSNPVFA